VSRYLLDTNIISNATKPEPSEALAAWMEAQADEDLFISALTVAEIQRGVLEEESKEGVQGTTKEKEIEKFKGNN